MTAPRAGAPRPEPRGPVPRRAVLHGAAVTAAALGAAASGILPPGAPAAAAAAVTPAGAARPAVLLAHGAWADGSSWSAVIEILQRAGYATIAVPLPLRSLAGDVAAVARALAAASGPVVDACSMGLPCPSSYISRLAAPGAFSRASTMVSRPSDERCRR